MIEQLIKSDDTFANMKAKMPEFFEQISTLRRTLNKNVHKQGAEQFYLVHYNTMIGESKRKKYIADFANRLSSCIASVAVIRLAIAPMLILLRDDEIYYRCFQSISDPYTQKGA